MRSRWGQLVLATLAVSLSVAPASAQVIFEASGTIASGAQYDLYPVHLTKGQAIVATLVCDETAPGNGDRPLDPVLSAFVPGNLGTDDTINADAYNDDGFGLDDDPAGVDCNAFDSSRIRFTPQVTGDHTFRVDGFGSSTGPYTLRIVAGPSILEIPTLSQVGLASLALLLIAASLVLLRRRRAA